MKRLNIHTITALFRSAKPSASIDDAFVNQLSQTLQQRANELAKHNRLPHITDTAVSSTKKPWFVWSGFGLGAMTVVITAIAFSSILTTPMQISGYIQKGPFITGSDIIIQELDDSLQPTGKSYQVTTSSDFGDYTLSQDIQSTYIEVIARGYYYDEVSGNLSSGPLTLRSIADVSETRHVNTNVLTTISVPRIHHLVEQERMPFAEAKQQAEKEVLSVFKSNDPAISHFETMDISKEGAQHGFLLATSAMLQGQLSVAGLSELLSKMSVDLQNDGQIADDSALIQTVRTQATQLSSYDIRTHLQQRFDALGVNHTIPEFESFLKPFVLNAEPFAYRVSLETNTFMANSSSGATIAVTILGDQFQENKEEVSLKNLFPATSVRYVDEQTLIAEFPIDTLAPGSYTVVVRNTETGRVGVTDGEPLEDELGDITTQRLVLQGPAPTIRSVTSSVSYLEGGTITIEGNNFTYGSFVWIDDWQVPQEAVRIANDQRIDVDLSSAMIVNNPALPRKQDLDITVQAPDFQTTEHAGFQIQ